MSCPIASLSASAVLALAFLAGDAAAQWSPPERLTNTPLMEWTDEGSLAIDGQNVLHALWIELDPGPGTRKLIYIRGRSGSWTAPEEVPTTGLTETAPDLAVHTDGTAHAVWHQGTGTAREIFHSTNRSGAWVTQQLTVNATEDTSPVVAVDGDGFAQVAWAGFDTVSGTGKIFHATDRSGSWTIRMLSGSNLGGGWIGSAPRISVSAAGVPQITYRGDNVNPNYCIRQATRSGGKWIHQALPSGNLSDMSSSVRTDFYGTCCLAISGNDAWGAPSRTWFTTSTDGGVTWAAPVLATGAYSAASPVLAVDWRGDAHIAWEETNGNFYSGTIFYTTNRGGAWTTTPLTGPDENAQPAIAVDGSGGVHVLYTNVPWGSTNGDIYYLTDASPTLALTLSPRGPTAIRRGDILLIDLTVENRTSGAIATRFWISAIPAVTGSEFLVPATFLNHANPWNGALPGGFYGQGTILLHTPPTMPPGLFTIAGTFGVTATAPFRDRSVFSVRIVP